MAKEKNGINLEQKVQQLTKENKKLRELKGQLLKTCGQVREEAAKIKKYAKQARRLPRKLMRARAKDNKLANDALTAYKAKFDYSMDKTKKGVRGLVVSSAMKAIMYNHPGSERFPWAYYDFPNKTLYYSPVTKRLLNIKLMKKELTLIGLLSYIRREDRNEIIKSLESGKGLSHYEAWTSGEDNKKSKKLMLSTFPFYYKEIHEEKHEERPVGVAIFLRDPKKANYSQSLRKFERQVQRTAKKQLEQVEHSISLWTS